MEELLSLIEQLCASTSYESSWTGGRGRFGPLGRWMVLQHEPIARARSAAIPHSWPTLTALAAQEGIRRENGQPYSVDAVRGTWSRIVRRRTWLEASRNQQAAAAALPMTADVPTRPPPAPALPTTSLMQPITASSLLPIRRYGDAR